MHVELHPRFANTPQGQTAQELTSACVHCGFCLSACPTYLDSRDERDSPRGRIYLVKQLLESGEASAATQLHLDRCLTCRSCETACPSGMRYGELVDIGRGLVAQQVPRPALDGGLRWLLRFVLTRPPLLRSALALGHLARPFLPAFLRRKIPPRQARRAAPQARRSRKMLLLEGCVQSAATPNTNIAAKRVLDKLGITLISAPQAGCCGAVNYHLAAHADGLDNMRRNIDAWWPHIQLGAEAIISSASGCGAMLIDYGRLLAHDPDYAEKAQRVAGLARDLGDVLLAEDLEALRPRTRIGKVAVHTPCTMQHALKRPDLPAAVLRKAGFELTARPASQQCCGSAGTYSLLQPAISQRLRENALKHLTLERPALIATANIGCQLHLQEQAGVPVVHWIELLDDS